MNNIFHKMHFSFDKLPPLKTSREVEDSWRMFGRNSSRENENPYVYKDIRETRKSASGGEMNAYDMELYIQDRGYDVFTDENGSKVYT